MSSLELEKSSYRETAVVDKLTAIRDLIYVLSETFERGSLGMQESERISFIFSYFVADGLDQCCEMLRKDSYVH